MFSHRIAWTVGILFLSGSLSLLQGDVTSDTLNIVVDFDDGRAFYLETLSGDVKITGVKGDEVKIIAVRNVKGSGEKARETLNKLKVDVNEGREKLEVITEFPGDEGFLSHIFGGHHGHSNAWVDFTISLPAHLRVVVDATSANANIKNIEGDMFLDLTSGDVVAEDLGGGTVVDGTSGNVELRRVKGDIVIDNTSGEAFVDGCQGNVEIDKTSGDVMVRNVDGHLEVDGTSCDVSGEDIGGFVTLNLISGDVNLKRVGEGISFDDISGDLRVSFVDAPRKDCQLSSISGDITMSIMKVNDLDFDLESVSGNLAVELEGLQIREMSKSSLRAFTGDGKVNVSIETVSGDVEIVGSEI
jgi:hypothetical protein